MSKPLTIPGEVADQITLANLKEYRSYLKKELSDHKKKGTYMHPEDVVGNTRSIECLDVVIHDFGG